MVAALIVGAVLLAASDPPPAPAASVSAVKVETVKDQKPQLVCRTETRPGSQMATRVCLTKAQEEERTRRAREMMDDMHRRGESERLPVR